jgi:hypothetical protein
LNGRSPAIFGDAQKKGRCPHEIGINRCLMPTVMDFSLLLFVVVVCKRQYVMANRRHKFSETS